MAEKDEGAKRKAQEFAEEFASMLSGPPMRQETKGALAEKVEPLFVELAQLRAKYDDQTVCIDRLVEQAEEYIEQRYTLKSQAGALARALQDILDSASSFDDPRIKYREAQIFRADEVAARAALAAFRPKEGK